MAIHVANQIALGRLAEEEDPELAPIVFEATRDIGRMNVSVGELRVSVEHSEGELAFMAIPYVLSAYHELLKAIQRFWIEAHSLGDEGEELAKQSLDVAHERLEELAGIELPEVLTDTFELARRIRNRIVHGGRRAGSNLRTDMRSRLRLAVTQWEEWSGAPLNVGERRAEMELGIQDVIAVLALTTKLARTMSAEIGRRLARDKWVAIALEDFRSSSPRTFGDPHRRVQSFGGFARTYYRALDFDEYEIREGFDVVDQEKNGRFAN